MSVIIDKLTAKELNVLYEITLKKITVQNNIKRLVETEMELDIQYAETLKLIAKNHEVDFMSGLYTLTPIGEIIPQSGG